MELRSKRVLAGSESTLSEMREDEEGGEFVCYILEDQIRSGPKVHGETAIPPGRYKILLRADSPKFAHYFDRWPWYRGVPWLQDVRDFTYVYIHPGTDDDDTDGCLLTGTTFVATADNNYVVRESRKAFEKVCKLIYAAMDRDEAVWLTVDQSELDEKG